MNNDLSKKLIFLLRGKERNSQIFGNINDFYHFISAVIDKSIDEKLINYLYNYMYTYCVSNKISIKYDRKDKVVNFVESVNNGTQIFSYISLSDLGDVKHLKIEVENNKEKKNLRKETHFSLDSCVDLVILSSEILDVDGSIESILESERMNEDFDNISFIDVDNPSTYKSFSIKPGTLLMDRDGFKLNSTLKNKNLTTYTKSVLEQLNLLYSEKEIEDEYFENIDNTKTR